MNTKEINIYDEHISNDFESSIKIIESLKNAPIVTVFGSARLKPTDKHYIESYNLTKELAKKGCHILTGGGPGIMESSNKGAFEAIQEYKLNTASVGHSIILKNEQVGNDFLTHEHKFEHLFVRKPMLIFYSKIYVLFAGGFGTLDELFEVLTLIQVQKLPKRKIYLFDSEFYSPLVDFFKKSLLANKTISEEDLDLFKVVDSIDEIINDCNCQ
jgi:uncharacterized protein (TIGR00730 family)